MAGETLWLVRVRAVVSISILLGDSVGVMGLPVLESTRMGGCQEGRGQAGKPVWQAGSSGLQLGLRNSRGAGLAAQATGWELGPQGHLQVCLGTPDQRRWWAGPHTWLPTLTTPAPWVPGLPCHGPPCGILPALPGRFTP